MLCPPRGHVVRPSMAMSAPFSFASQAGAVLGRDRECDMHRAMTVMRRDGAAGQMHRFQRMAAQEQQQHAAMPDVVGAQPLVAIDAV